jgi:uncharacterized membrane protein
VPIHWNAKGEIDQYGSKETLILLPLLLPLLTYLIFAKYHQLKNVLVMFSSFLSVFILYLTKNESAADLIFLLVIVGLLYAASGNYFKTLQPNYFIGIRTPWTLESEEIWKKTHQLSGVIWFIGGILLALSGFLFPEEFMINILIAITVILIAIPVIYSFVI